MLKIAIEKQKFDYDINNAENAFQKSDDPLYVKPMLPALFRAIPFAGGPTSRQWIKSSYLPSYIDKKLRQLYLQRTYFYFVQQTANSTVDIGIELNSFHNMMKYIPRAMQIAFLSPLPNKWFSNDSVSTSSLMYLITGFEMIFLYIFYIGAIYAIYIWRNKEKFWIIVSFSIYSCIYPVYAFPNIGAIVRYRYGGLMLIAALGISAFIYLLSNKGNIEKK